MTSKEKAEEIWLKIFQNQVEIVGWCDGGDAVKLSIIMVDEILKAVTMIADKKHEYWQEVKQHLKEM
jgi:hypothetical protein